MILSQITERRRANVEERRRTVPESALRSLAEATERRPLDFAGALGAAKGVAVIAEVKRRSPSAGTIREGLDVAGTCRMYSENGAAAVSVLTEPNFFGGSLADFEAARSTLTGGMAMPLLLKDFVLTSYQVLEARAAGADAVLLIVACLMGDELPLLLDLVLRLGMTPLVEVHDRAELEAVSPLRPPVIGINNRDLRTFEVSLETTVNLAPEVPDGCLVVSESGIRTPADVRQVAAAGARAVLVGESILRADDPASQIRALAQATA